MKYFYQLCITALLPVAALAQSSQTVSFDAGKDNSIYQESANSNAKGENIFTGNTILGAGNSRRALLQFPLSFPGPGGVTIVSATLTLYCTKTIAGPIAVSLHRLTADWGEGTSNAGASADGTGTAPTTGDATWQDRFYTTTPWSTGGGSYVATASATTQVDAQGAAYSWTSAQLAADVQAWVNNPGTNFGWIVIGDEANPTTAKRFGSRENSNAAFRPVLTVTYQPNPVPVTLLQFAAQETRKGVQLSWQTAQELNNAWFDVQHSTDGRSYTTIGRINGAGNSSSPISYSYIHEGLQPGNQYYRLAQTDFDGKINYSRVVQLATSRVYAGITISPSPATSFIQSGGASWRSGSAYRITGPSGVAVQQGILQGSQLNVARLPAGIYMVQLQHNGTTLHGRFVKQ